MTERSLTEDLRVSRILGTLRRLLSEDLGIGDVEPRSRDALDDIVVGLDRLTEGLAARQAAHARTEQQLRESKALLESESQYRAMVEDQPDLLCRFKPDGTLTFVNHGYAEYFGRSVEELEGYSFYNLIPEEERQAVREHFSEMGPDKLTATIVHEVVSADGQIRWQEWTDRAFVDDAGNVTDFQSIGRDITARKRAEEALRASEARHRALIDGVPDMMFRFEIDGTILDYKAEESRSWMPGEEVIGTRLMELPMPAEVAEALLKASAQAVQSGELQVLEYDLPAAAGMVSCEARIVRSGSAEVIDVVRDVTEHKQAEEERERLIVDLEQKNTELERFTYTVSHDLKSPLVTIRGFLGWLERDVVAGDVERVRTDVERIQKAAETMRLLLDGLLDLSRIGRAINPPAPVSLAELAREAVELVEGPIRERGVELEIAPALPVVSGDRQRLLEVFQNLIENAVKFIGEQSAPRVEIGFREKDGATVFYVRDNGMGLAPGYRQKVFGLFERLNAEIEGTGIGLALVKRIVELHGGRLWVESEGEGRGSTFCFTLAEAGAAAGEESDIAAGAV